MSALTERDRLTAERAATAAAIRQGSLEAKEAAAEIETAEIETANAFQNLARGTKGESPEAAEARGAAARSRHGHAEKVVEEAYRAQRAVDGELGELYRGERLVFIEEAEVRTKAFTAWRTKAAATVGKLMKDGRDLELDAFALWNPLASALRIEPPRISQVAAISNRAQQLALDVPRPAAIEVDGESVPELDALPEAGTTVWIIYPNGHVDQADVGTPTWDRAVENGAEITSAPPGLE